MTLHEGSKLTPVTVAGEHGRGQRLQMQVARPRILSTPAPQFLAHRHGTIHQSIQCPFLQPLRCSVS